MGIKEGQSDFFPHGASCEGDKLLQMSTKCCFKCDTSPFLGNKMSQLELQRKKFLQREKFPFVMDQEQPKKLKKIKPIGKSQQLRRSCFRTVEGGDINSRKMSWKSKFGCCDILNIAPASGMIGCRPMSSFYNMVFPVIFLISLMHLDLGAYWQVEYGLLSF